MPKSFAVLLLATAAIVAVLPLATSAAPITVPTDLNPGDTYRLVFVTSSSRDATSPNIADYNAFVTAVAATVPELAALGTTWTAIGSTAAVDARDNTGTNPFSSVGVPIYDMADGRIADSNADLWDSELLKPIDIYEDGSSIATYLDVFTGSTDFGTAHGEQYLGTEESFILAEYGLTLYAWNAWVSFDSTSTSDTLPFYAISGELTVVPEPASLILATFGLVGLAARGWRQKR